MQRVMTLAGFSHAALTQYRIICCRHESCY